MWYTCGTHTRNLTILSQAKNWRGVPIVVQYTTTLFLIVSVPVTWTLHLLCVAAWVRAAAAAVRL